MAVMALLALVAFCRSAPGRLSSCIAIRQDWQGM